MVNRAKSREERLDLLNRFITENYKSDPSYTSELVEEAFLQAKEIGYRKGLGEALANRGYIKLDQKRYDEALQDLEEAEDIVGSLPEESRAQFSSILLAMGYIFILRSQISLSIDYFTEAIAVSEEVGEPNNLSKAYLNLGVANLKLERPELALHYYMKAKEIQESKGSDTLGLIIINNNIGDLYNKLRRHEKAIPYLERALELCRKRGLNHHSSMALTTMAEVYMGLGEYKRALATFKKALKVFRQVNRVDKVVMVLIDIGRLCSAEGKTRSGFYYLKEAVKVSEENGFVLPLSEAQRELYLLCKKRKRYKEALFHLSRVEKINEKHFEEELDKNVNNVESEALKMANQQIKVISSIGRKITSTLDMKAVLDRVYESINSLLEATIFGIIRCDWDKGMTYYDMFVENGKLLPVIYGKIDDPNSMAALVIRERRDVIISDVEKEIADYYEAPPRFIGDESNPYAKSMLYIPLIHEDIVYGTLTVQSYRKNCYTTEDLDTLKILGSYIAIALNNARQAELIRTQNRELNRISMTDYLTGVYNRREFEKRLTSVWNSSTAVGNHFSILLIDADHFKKINDTFGHPVGDECLKRLASIFKNEINRPGDCLARYGGEEFIILVNRPAGEALKLAEKLCRKVRWNPITFKGDIISLTISIGLSSIPVSQIDAAKGPEKLIARADEALYRSKNEGRDRVTYLPLEEKG